MIHGILESGEESIAPQEITSPPAPLLQERGVKQGVIENYRSIPAYVKELSKKLRQQQTPAEEILWEILRNRQLNDLKFRRQYAF